MDLCVTTFHDSLEGYAFYSLVVFINSCAAICLFMQNFLVIRFTRT